jgi:hypothetical protein
MISSETPDKLRAIIQDTWPNLYYLKTDDRKPGTRRERDEKRRMGGETE